MSTTKDNEHAKSDNEQTPSHKDGLSILVVSGRSGSGKTSVLNILEDLGYYSIDNMPLSLVPEAAQKLVCDSGIKRVALGVDIRTPRADLSNFSEIHDTLKQTYGEEALTVIYVTAQEDILVARFNATRRIHPWMVQDSKGIENTTYNLPAAIEREIQLLQPIFKHADVKIDTTMLNIHQLKERLRDYGGVDNQIVINLLSFGFKYGSPIDADFVFDVRMLPNPHYETDLRDLTGLDPEVVDFLQQQPDVALMQKHLETFLSHWLVAMAQNHRSYVTVAIGCTGGQHRSVYLVERLTEIFGPKWSTQRRHRELDGR